MSFSLSDLNSGLSSIGDLLGAYPVKLGSFSFQDFEVPESITWGGQQALSVHKLPGGGRVIDSMGRDDRAIEWSGYLLSSDAQSRATALDAIRNAGATVLLTWGTSSYNVVVRSIQYEHRKVNLIRYRISCEVLSLPSGPANQSLLGKLTQSISDATGIDLPGDLQQVSSTLSTVQTTLSSVSSVLPLSPGITNIIGKLNGASNVVTGLSNVANGQISGFGLAFSGLSGSGASKVVGALTLAGSAINNADALNRVGNFLGVASKLATSPSQ